MILPKSPRYIPPREVEALAARARGRADVVAVTVDADDALLAEIQAAFSPDLIQLHGAETPSRVTAARRFARKGVIKVLPIARAEDFAPVAAFEPVADMLMFDAKAPPNADRTGGHGVAFDWKLLSGKRFSRPWLLAGGLNPENVASALSQSGAPALDVSSGVESAPGVKDAGRIADFLAAAKRA